MVVAVTGLLMLEIDSVKPDVDSSFVVVDIEVGAFVAAVVPAVGEFVELVSRKFRK